MSTMTENTSKLRTITPDQLAQFTETVEIDPNANAFNKPLPVPDGIYVIQVSAPVKQGNFDPKPALQGGTDKNGDSYFFANFDAKIVQSADPNIDAQTLKGRVKTLRTQRLTSFSKTDSKTGTETSELGTFVNAAGAQLGGQVSLSDLGYAYLQVIEAKAQLGAVIEWQAGRMVDSDRVNPATGKAYREWQVVKRGMRNFPQNEDGSHNPTITFDGEELTARAEIVGYVRLS